MRALRLTEDNRVRLENVPRPEKAEAGYLIVKMIACGINAGDQAFIAGAFAKGTIPVSLYDVCGVSGVGTVEQVGSGVPKECVGKQVAIYRSLKFSDTLIGTWCEKAHVHWQHCALLPDRVNPEEYAGSLVNAITPFAFIKQIAEEGHQGILATAGTSATGLAMLGVCEAYDFPLISIVRNERAKEELELLGAKNILVQTAPHFNTQLAELSQQHNTTAVFDGVGAALLNSILDALPLRTTVYSYGYLGGFSSLTLPMGLLMKKQLVIKSFGNFTSQTVVNPARLDEALTQISQLLHRPHFKTKVGKKFSFGEIGEALTYTSTSGGKAILYPDEARK